jgi:hypothetical protein
MQPLRISSVGSIPREQPDFSQSFDLVSFSESTDDSKDDILINNLCAFIKNLGHNPPILALNPSWHILASKKAKYIMKTSPLSSFSLAVSLDDYLPLYQEWEISQKERMDLASSLSLIILLLYSTPWIDMWWTWKDLCTLRDDKSQIFITRNFYSASLKPLKRTTSHSDLTSTFWAIYGEPILTRLGIALVELALGKRLPEFRQPNLDQNVDLNILDLQTAIRLVDSGCVLREAGPSYNDAVQACLMHRVILPSGVIVLNSKNSHFQQDLERFVVAPIRRSRDFHADSSGHSLGNSIYSSVDSLPIDKGSIEPDWITYEWEIPEVISLRGGQREQQTLFAETLRTTVVLTGYDSYVEATTCEGYMKREWGDLGLELLELIISGIGYSPKSPGEYFPCYVFYTNLTHLSYGPLHTGLFN